MPRLCGVEYQVAGGRPVQAKTDLDARSDLELVAAINAGDESAFEVLYFRYRDWVTSLAYRFTGDESAALDVLQETFLYVLKKVPGLHLTATFKTFIYPAVRNLSIAARDKAHRYQATEAQIAHVENTAATETRPGAQDDLASVLAALSEEHREVLLLRFVYGLDLVEVAEAINIPLGTVKSRLHNALALLRNSPKTRKFFE